MVGVGRLLSGIPPSAIVFEFVEGKLQFTNPTSKDQSIRLALPITHLTHSYFEIKILHLAGVVGVGVCEPESELSKVLPGWTSTSYGYHSDDGMKYNSWGGLTSPLTPPFGPPFAAGDVIGCGLSYTTIYFTKNGALLGGAFQHLEAKVLFPMLGMDGPSLVQFVQEEEILFHPARELLASRFSFTATGLEVEVGRDCEYRIISRGKGIESVTLLGGFKRGEYFEVEVERMAGSGCVAVGVAEKERSVEKHKLPGWGEGSCGYHSDDGRKFISDSYGEAYGPAFKEGDRVGCGWMKGIVFFTKNDVVLGTAFVPKCEILYPSIGIEKPACLTVRLNCTVHSLRFQESGDITLNLPEDILQMILVMCSTNLQRTFQLGLVNKSWNTTIFNRNQQEIWKAIALLTWPYLSFTNTNMRSWFTFVRARRKAAQDVDSSEPPMARLPIENCGKLVPEGPIDDSDLQWQLQCPLIYANLPGALKVGSSWGGRPDYLVCDVCKQNVYWVASTDELIEAVSRGMCVVYTTEEEQPRRLMGKRSIIVNPFPGLISSVQQHTREAERMRRMQRKKQW